MNFSISREKFFNLLYLANTIVERRNTMPILANVRLTAENSKLSVSATDLEVSLVGEADAAVKTPGSITVDAKVLYEIVRELPNEMVQAQVSRGARLELECGASHFKINAVSSEEFPSIVGVSLHKPIALEAGKLAEMLEKTAFAVSTDETRYNINGVHMETVDASAKEKYLRLVATDGHRLAVIDRPAEGVNVEKSVIIPRKGIQELRKVLEGNEGAAHLSLHEGFFTVQSAGVTLGIRLVDGQFPDYRQVIPTESTTLVKIERDALLSSVKRVSLVTTDKSKAIKFKLQAGTLTISSSSPEYGEAADSISAEQSGPDITIGFSARYLIDLLTAMDRSASINIRLNGELGPGVFVGDDDDLYSCLVMPMRFE